MTLEFEVKDLIRKSRSAREGEQANRLLTKAEEKLKTAEANLSRDGRAISRLRGELQEAANDFMWRRG